MASVTPLSPCDLRAMLARSKPLAIARRLTEAVIVGVSCGKDSVAVLDLCHAAGMKVYGYFLYEVPGLSWQQEYLQYLSERYDCPIKQYPHPNRVAELREGYYCQAQPSLPPLTFRECWEAARAHYGLEWIAGGEKKLDSLERRAQLVSWGAVQPARHRIFPLADWTHKEVFQYLQRRGVRINPEYALNDGKAFNGITRPESLSLIKRHFPADYQKVLKDFPMAEASRLRYDAAHYQPQ